MTISRSTQLRTIHNFLLDQTFYPLFLCTLLGFAFTATRIVLMRRFDFRFLIFNLFLAWIPYFLSLAALHLHQSRDTGRGRERTLIALVWLTWLVMFPNAPYIITDFIHLRDTPPLTWWYDLGLVMTFALAGCFCGVVSLRIMHDIVRARLGSPAGWIFVTTVATLAGFGIYLGRFLRWNSWDLLTHPHHIAWHIATRITNPFAHPRTIGVTFMFGAMTMVIYLMFTSLQPRRQ